MPTDAQRIVLWDGDFDRADDTDDPNTGDFPPFPVSPGTEPEGARPGRPLDDGPPGSPLRHPPSIMAVLRDPTDMPVAVNNNPSGDREWEQFVISTDTADSPDVRVDTLRAGEYRLDFFGVDARNTLFVFTEFDLLGDSPGSIGDEVYRDYDEDGIRDPGEPGIPDVIVRLIEADPDGVFDSVDDIDYGQHITDADGLYRIDNLSPGRYRVDVDEMSLPPDVDPIPTTGNDPMILDLGRGEHFDEACTSCTTSMRNLTLRYDGAAATQVSTVLRYGLPGETVLFNGVVAPGELVPIARPDGRPIDGPVGIVVGGALRHIINVGCEALPGVGSTIGDFTLVQGITAEVRRLCPLMLSTRSVAVPIDHGARARGALGFE